MIRKGLFLLSILSITTLWAATQIPQLKPSECITREQAIAIRNAMDKSLLENAHAVTYAEKIYFEYQPDGCDVTWVDLWAQILTEQGAKEWDSYETKEGEENYST